MELVTPGLGLIIWMGLSFLILLFILGKFAWKPIMKSIKEREEFISQSITNAHKAKEELAKIQATAEKILLDAREQKDAILRDAKKMSDQMINEAKTNAARDSQNIITSAKETIRNERIAAVADLKNQMASISLDIAGKILRQQLASDTKQQELVNQLLKEVQFS